jgi:hypothetical protein
MNARDVSVVAAFALCTFAVESALWLPDSADADGPADEVRPTIAAPVLKTSGCEITARLVPAEKKGDVPQVEVTAKNPSKTAATLDVHLRLVAPAPPRSALSRVPPMPLVVWDGACPLTLAAGESQTKTVATKDGLPASILRLELAQGTDSVTIDGVTVAPPAAPTTSPAGDRSAAPGAASAAR